MNTELNVIFTATTDWTKELVAGQWRKLVRNGSWNGRIVVRLNSIEELRRVFDHVDSRGMCVNGVVRTVVTSSVGNMGNRNVVRDSAVLRS